MEKTQDVMEWDYDIPILNNRFIMRGVGTALGIPLVLLALLISFFYIKDMREGNVMPEMDFSWIPAAILVIAAVLSITALFILIIYKNRMRAHFRLDNEEVHYYTRSEDRKKNTAINTLALFISVILKRPGAASAAMAAQMTQESRIRWKKIDKVKVYDSSKAILVRGGFGNKIMIYCNGDNYENVRNLIKDRVRDGLI